MRRRRRPGGRVSTDVLAHIQVRAMVATDLSVAITDATPGENRLLWVNPAFERVTGYAADEAVGRNCRFLQGPATDPDSVARLRRNVGAASAVTVTMLNYRKDGAQFWNQVSLSPVFDEQGGMIAFVGIQMDVSDRVRADDERRQAYAAERTARLETERARQETETARRRLALLAEATTQLASTLDVDETLDRLARLVVPILADWVAISLLDARGGIERTVFRHHAGKAVRPDRTLFTAEVTEGLRVERVKQAGTPMLVADARQPEWRPAALSDEIGRIVEALEVGSVMYVPLVARRKELIGSITFVAEPSGRTFTEEDLEVASDIGRRAGITLDNARLYEREHRVAETLQRSLLPDLPEIEGLTIEARYRPSDATVDVGGDFYDVLPLPDGSVGVAVGDVVGHDLTAAAAMGHLRGLLRAAAWGDAEDGHGQPAGVLDRVDRLVQGLDVVPLATLFYGRLERSDTGPGWWRLTYASAGHPPPLLRTPDGKVRILDEAQGILLGVTDTPDRPTAAVDLPPGSTLVGFTDGLVERRRDSVDLGYTRIVDALESCPPGDPAGPALVDTLLVDTLLVDILLAAAGPDGSDDTAIIAIQTRPVRP